MGHHGLASVKFHDAIDKVGFPAFTHKDEVALRDDGAYSDFFLGLAHENYSTMLVRTATVPEPGAFVAFATAIVAFSWRRRQGRFGRKTRL